MKNKIEIETNHSNSSNLTQKLNNEKQLFEKYYTFFEYAPISLWIEDFSHVKQYLDKIVKENDTDIKTFLKENPAILPKLVSLVAVKDFNKEAVKMYKANTKKHLLENLHKVFTEESDREFAKLLVDILTGIIETEGETTNKTLDGTIINTLVKFKVAEGSESTLENIIVSVEDITERIKIKNSLIESNQRFEDQLKNTPLASILWDLNYNIIEWNAAAEKIFGYKAEEVKGKPNAHLLTPPHLISEMEKLQKNLLTYNEGFKNTNENITKSGKIITCDWYSVTLKDAKGNVIGITSLVDDITEQINSTKFIEKSEKKYKDIFEKSIDSVFILRDGFFEDCNESAIEMFGHKTKQSLLKIHPSQLSPETQFDGSNSYLKAEEMIKIALETGSNRFRWDHQQKNGNVFPCEVTLTRINEIDSTPAIHSVVRDIADRIKNEILEDVLYNISKAALTTIDFKEFSLFIRNELHKIIDTSNFYIAIYNTETDMITTPVFVDDREEVEEFSAKKSLTGYVIKTKKPLILDEGALLDLVKTGEVDLIGELSKIWLGVPLKIGEDVFGAIVVQSYTNKNAYNENDVNLLEFVADQISTTIQRKKVDNELKEALNQAKEADRLKSAFLANMSHEIRTPMNGIIGFSEFFLEPDLSETKRKEYAKVIINSSKHLLEIVNDILDISAIEAGSVKLKYESVQLNKLLDNLEELYNPIAKQNQLEFTCKKGLGNFDSIIEIDKVKLNQVLSNLLSNAFKFTNKGSVEFGYQLLGNVLQFYIKDTGVGIEESLQEKIFDRFIQANHDLNKKHRGTGLGLAITKKFVELFNGQIWLSSNKEGTTIYFTIPYTKSKNFLISSVVKQQKPAIQVKNKELIILVAEDEEFNMLYLNELFSRKENYKIIEASNGLEAVELSKKHPEIDLILMDIKMPIMSGNEAMKEIKKLRSTLPIVALSAFAMESDKKAALDIGFDGYLTKPIDRKQLFDLLDNYSNEIP